MTGVRALLAARGNTVSPPSSAVVLHEHQSSHSITATQSSDKLSFIADKNPQYNCKKQ